MRSSQSWPSSSPARASCVPLPLRARRCYAVCGGRSVRGWLRVAAGGSSASPPARKTSGRIGETEQSPATAMSHPTLGAMTGSGAANCKTGCDLAMIMFMCLYLYVVQVQPPLPERCCV
jgi:hypothetical protein